LVFVAFSCINQVIHRQIGPCCVRCSASTACVLTAVLLHCYLGIASNQHWQVNTNVFVYSRVVATLPLLSHIQ